MKGRRGRLLVQALGYVNYAKVILGIAENSGRAPPFMSAWYHSLGDQAI